MITSPNLEIHGINTPKPGELDMPAKARLVNGKYWYVEINWKGETCRLTQWRNQHFTPEIAAFLEQVINNQILTAHFRWDEWFPGKRKRFLWNNAYWTWLDSKVRAPSTVCNIKYKYQHFKRLYNKDLRDLRQADFLWIREKHGDTAKAKAMRQVAQAFLNWAWKSEILDRQVFLPPISVRRGKTPYLSSETRWAIYDVMKDPYRDPMLMGIEMGMRIGEICALQWGDIDWAGDGINLCHTMSAYKLKDSRKGGDEVWLPMTPKVKEILEKLRQQRNSIGGFVFVHPSGRQIWTQQLSSNFKTACRSIGIPNSRFHHLRNSFLHDLSEAGATTREAGALAGHRSEQTTERYIGRWSKQKIREIASLRKGG